MVDLNRMGMSNTGGIVGRYSIGGATPFVSDSFTEGSDTALASHTGETGATWTVHPSYSASTTVWAATDRIIPTGSPQCYYASGVPPSADYYVQGSLYVASTIAVNFTIAGRIDTSANNMYIGGYFDGTEWRIRKCIGGGFTTLGTPSTNQLITPGNAKTVKLVMNGTSLSLYVEGVLEVGPVTDSEISAAGRVGFRSSGGVSDTTGFHLENIEAASL